MTAAALESESARPPAVLARGVHRTESGWLLSQRADFWLAAGGASLGIAAMVVWLAWHGSREVDASDFVLSELHLGATYDAIVRRKLWRRMPLEVLAVPLAIVAATFALMHRGHEMAINTALLYLAVWHRGRQDFGIARYYQRQAGGVLSLTHDRLFRAAIYLPMLAATLFYTRAHPTGDAESDYFALPWSTHAWRHGLDLTVGAAALAAVIAYFAYVRSRPVHRAERWVVLAHVTAFASAYVLGAWRASFVLVIGIFHEVQYLAFTYAIARRDPARSGGELRFASGFLVLPLVGLALTLGVERSHMAFLEPLGEGLLLAHYWLDGRIWRGPALRPAR